MTKQLEREHALACRVNIKWRKWVRAGDKALAPYHSDEDVAKSAALLKEFVAFMREHEVHDYQDGEHFGIVRENGDVLRFRFARKGDPVFRELEPNLEN